MLYNNIESNKDDFNDVIETAYELTDEEEIYYFFDEIQIIDGWEHFARRMADQKKHVYITGSNAKMLSIEIEKVLLGDIIEREKVNNKMAIRLMIKKIAETVMHEISYNTLAGNIKATGIRTSTDTMIDYVSYAENAYLLFRNRNFVSKIAEKESLPRFYFYDNGLMALFLIDKQSILLENAVAVYLRRRYGEEVYYYKSKQTGIDIDFYLPEENCAIQVAYSLEEAEDREIKSLISFAEKNAEIGRLIIVTNEEERTITKNDRTIEVIPAFKFLM